ncbi:uncharacterized protein METZ01_LOCUS301052 [marine metagenome]|uniref:Uncharacterized protein n=1 Tax=marine metagenome TaxID=408172 RepID=A0A382MI83_9ZZZZ
MSLSSTSKASRYTTQNVPKANEVQMVSCLLYWIGTPIPVMILNNQKWFMTERKNEMNRIETMKKWDQFTLKGMSEYINMLENRIVELGKEIETLTSEADISKEKERLTNLWARGEMEN